MKRHGRTAGKRSNRGLQLLEVAASATALTVMTVFCLDACIVILGFMFNDAACRDAARAASQTKSATQALLIAQKTAQSHQGDGNFWSTPLVESADVEYQDYGGTFSAVNVPYVTVTTHCSIKLPAPLLFLGADLKPDGSFQSKCSYTFPLTNINLVIPGEAP